MPDLSDKVSELAPCPFCGNDECHLVVFEREDDSRAPRPHRVYKAYCGICEAEVERESPDWWNTNKPPETESDLVTRAKVVTAWNRRTRPPASSVEGWRTMDSAPRDGTKFDVWQHGQRVTDVYWSDVQDDWCIDGSYGPEEPTPLAVTPPIIGWRPLPASPIPPEVMK